MIAAIYARRTADQTSAGGGGVGGEGMGTPPPGSGASSRGWGRRSEGR
jgi:hypothetical protein